MTAGELLKSVREALGLKGHDIEALAGTDPLTDKPRIRRAEYSKIETGTTLLRSHDKVRGLMEAYGVTHEQLAAFLFDRTMPFDTFVSIARRHVAPYKRMRARVEQIFALAEQRQEIAPPVRELIDRRLMRDASKSDEQLLEMVLELNAAIGKLFEMPLSSLRRVRLLPTKTT